MRGVPARPPDLPKPLRQKLSGRDARLNDDFIAETRQVLITEVVAFQIGEGAHERLAVGGPLEPRELPLGREIERDRSARLREIPAPFTSPGQDEQGLVIDVVRTASHRGRVRITRDG